MSIEQNFNIGFIASLALREKQIQQVYRPIIAVHKWFARRPGSLFRGLLLSEFGDKPVEHSYYMPNEFYGKSVADPFMGGGTPLIEANRVGCNVTGIDINPMSAWVVREEIESIRISDYERAVERLNRHLQKRVGDLYKTRCVITGREDVDVKYFLWVKQGKCEGCRDAFDLFPGYILAEDARHTSYVIVCSTCGELNESNNHGNLGRCICGTQLRKDGPVKRNKCVCPKCGYLNRAPFHGKGPPIHRLFAIEYHNSDLKKRPGRLFKRPDVDDLARVTQAESALKRLRLRFVPDNLIPEGDESSRLHRWGYERFHELFNSRQKLALEISARYISGVANARVRRALATNFSDLLRYQNMLCRYDTWALKSLDVFSVHGFPVAYVQAESNFIGIRTERGVPVGSGGWVNISEKYAKAKKYCTEPFEVKFDGKKKSTIFIKGEWIGSVSVSNSKLRSRHVDIQCASSTDVSLPQGNFDAVFTDPPYFGMVQYGELMQFCYVWLRKLAGRDFSGLEFESTLHSSELTGNVTADRGIEHFAEGLAAVYSRMAEALKPGAPLVFTFHHNQQISYQAAAMGILDAGLTCSASFPCPAEMGGSIHIHGTNSSIVDTVFVCRKSGATFRNWIFSNADELAKIVVGELDELRHSGMKATVGDIRCIVFGHITRMSIWKLRSRWDLSRTTKDKLEDIRLTMDSLATVEGTCDAIALLQNSVQVAARNETDKTSGERFDAITF